MRDETTRSDRFAASPDVLPAIPLDILTHTCTNLQNKCFGLRFQFSVILVCDYFALNENNPVLLSRTLIGNFNSKYQFFHITNFLFDKMQQLKFTMQQYITRYINFSVVPQRHFREVKILKHSKK